MRIEIAVVTGRTRANHLALGERLRAKGHVIRFRPVQAGHNHDTGVAWLMTLEDMVYGPLKRDLLVAASVDGPGFDGSAELLIDLTGAAAPFDGVTLFPLFDGLPGEVAAISAVLDGRAPRTTIARRDADGRERSCVSGLAAIEHRHRFKDCLNRVVARLNDLLVMAVADHASGRAALKPMPVANGANGSIFAPARFGLASLAGRLEKRLKQLGSGGETWRVAWRGIKGDATRDTFAWPNADYTYLRDDGARYFADPFVFVKGGETFVFVEEYPYATRKGVISVFTISADGLVGAPRPALEASYHLSYPFVFEHDGVIYMMPETCAANRLELYRAERFPDVWVREATLLEGVPAADATMTRHDGRFWIFATVGENGHSDWDSLHLFHADAPLGPWRAHPKNPVLIDASQARPAGHFFKRDGRLYRPTQDCSAGYGSALAICDVTCLDLDHYEQRPLARLSANPGAGSRGVHTLNDSAGIEVIDLLGSRMGNGSALVKMVNYANL